MNTQQTQNTNPAAACPPLSAGLAVDPYIEAQKRIDAGIATRNYDSALPIDIAERCRAAMKLPSIIEMQQQLRDLQELGKIQKRNDFLKGEIQRLTANVEITGSALLRSPA